MGRARSLAAGLGRLVAGGTRRACGIRGRSAQDQPHSRAGAGDDQPAAAAAHARLRRPWRKARPCFAGLCSGCHGGAGRGGKGPDLTDNRWIHGGTDQDIARVIQNGVPKTTMKKLGDSLKQDQIRKLIAYIRSLARSSGREHLETLHGRRSASGPEALLRSHKARPSARSAIAWAAREAGSGRPWIASPAAAPPEFIMESILQPSKEIAPEYEAVAVATKEGRVITGLRVNETNFSIQLHEENGRFHSFLKRDLAIPKNLKSREN